MLQNENKYIHRDFECKNCQKAPYKDTRLIVCWHCQAKIAIQDLKDTVIMELKKLWGKI